VFPPPTSAEKETGATSKVCGQCNTDARRTPTQCLKGPDGFEGQKKKNAESARRGLLGGPAKGERGPAPLPPTFTVKPRTGKPGIEITSFLG